MARRREGRPDVEIQLPDGRVMIIEAKDFGHGITVSDAMRQAVMHVGGASAAAVGAASVFGWYVRSGAPWRGDDAIRADWQTVGDDLWRATGEITRSKAEDDQTRLFDPGEYAKSKG